MYERALSKEQLIGMFKTSFQAEEDNFDVPIAKTSSDVGIKDSFGKENFYIAIVKSDIEITKLQIKLK